MRVILVSFVVFAADVKRVIAASASDEAIPDLHAAWALGMVRSTRPQVRNCAPGNLEILRGARAPHSSMLRIAPE
jgi:hypothetical protein